MTKQVYWVNALLDSGNSVPLLSRSAAEQLGLKGYSKELTVHGVSGIEVKENSLVTRVEVCGADGKTVVECTVCVIEDPTGNLVAVDWTAAQKVEDVLRDIEIVKPVRDGRVEMILGCNTPQALTVLEERLSVGGQVGVRRTPFGWIPFGVCGAERASAEGEGLVSAALHSYKISTQSCKPWLPERELDFASSYAFGPGKGKHRSLRLSK